MQAVAEAAQFLSRDNLNMTIVLTVRPTDAEPEYGWVEPGPPVASCGQGTLTRIATFIEKPAIERARSLMEAGWLWNTMVIVGRARALLLTIRQTCPELAAYFSLIQRTLGTMWESEVLHKVYQMIPDVNFSRAVLACRAEELLTLPVSGVVWSDWGRQEHILAMLQRLGRPAAFPFVSVAS